jgi:hypothetical protein
VQLLPPYRFRFTEAEDVAAYGDRWWTWDEGAVARLAGREMIALEETVGLTIVEVFRDANRDATGGKLAAMWIALHLAGHEVAWPDFNPMVLLSTWELVPEEPAPGPLDGGSGEAQPTPDSGSSPEPTAESATCSPE